MEKPDEISVSREYHDSMIGGLHTLKSLGIDVRDKAERLIERALAVSPPPAVVPLTIPSSGVGNLPKTIFVFAVAGILSATAGAGYSFRGTTMPAKSVAKNKGDASGYLVAAREAQIRKEWEKAATNYHHAFDCGSGAECSLGREAECLFYAGKYEDAMATLDQLEKATHGETATAPYIRGLIAFQEKDHATAKVQFGMAEMAGDRRAVLMLKRIP